MTFRWGRTGRAAQKWLLLPEQRHDPPGKLRVVHYPSNTPRTRTIKVNGDVGRRVAFGSENISDTALGAGKITVAARDGEPPGFMVGVKFGMPVDFAVQTSEGILHDKDTAQREGDMEEILVVGYGTQKK